MGTMWIFWSVTVCVMHSVQNRISSRRQIGTSLTNPGKEIEKLFPVFVHRKHLMGSIPMEEETLAEQREIPMQEKENNQYHCFGIKN